MLRFGTVQLEPEYEPPRPAVHAFWRVLEGRDDLDDGLDGEGPGGSLPYESVDVSVERRALGSPGTMPISEIGSPGQGYRPGDETLATDVILNIGEPPKLTDYLARCESEEDGCEGRTFETMENGTLRWVEPSTDPDAHDYTEIENVVVKEGGRITEQQEVTWGRFQIPEFLTAQGGMTTVMRPLSWSRKTNGYYDCCPEALRSSVEVTYDVRNPLEFPVGIFGQVAGGPVEWAEGDNVYLSSRKTLSQRYQAEGWLRHKVETSLEFAFWWFSVHQEGVARRITPQPRYRRHSRSETYTPIGSGRWLVRVTEVTAGFVPVATDEPQLRIMGVDPGELVGTDYGGMTRAWTEITDQAPPTVSCSQLGAEGETCEERATREYNEALDEYNRRLEQYQVGIVNNPPLALRQSVRTSLRANPALGQVIAGPAGSGIVVSASFDGRRGGDAEPEHNVGYQLLSRIRS